MCVVAVTNMKLIRAIFPDDRLLLLHCFCLIPYCLLCIYGFTMIYGLFILIISLFQDPWSHKCLHPKLVLLFECVKPVVEGIIILEFNVLWGNFCLLWCSVFYTLRQELFIWCILNKVRNLTGNWSGGTVVVSVSSGEKHTICTAIVPTRYGGLGSLGPPFPGNWGSFFFFGGPHVT